ncbi:hypothetical protein ZIOFF_020820 [Zingiber officinale]|uniref:Transmembrane protein n=1 Tax=Zingiber officinale TaxID=94328 RepID=A0A8J5LJ83_ZINOF|nr:hypothetical protein ZIOFF_020820 [Zingiber officinale]
MGRIRQSFLAVILLILLFQTSSGDLELGTNVAEPPNTAYLLSKMETRVELEFTVLDYDYGGHNGRHEHIKGKPGGTSSKNP